MNWIVFGSTVAAIPGVAALGMRLAESYLRPRLRISVTKPDNKGYWALSVEIGNRRREPFAVQHVWVEREDGVEVQGLLHKESWREGYFTRRANEYVIGPLCSEQCWTGLDENGRWHEGESTVVRPCYRNGLSKTSKGRWRYLNVSVPEIRRLSARQRARLTTRTLQRCGRRLVRMQSKNL